jgi:Xaa-Pro aminopeptidase
MPSDYDVCLPAHSAAVIHYKPERGSCAVIDPDAIYLCDSGAQYLDGTTDTTRTLHFTTPKPEERKAYTLVLKGNIALDTAVFPKGTTGYAIDALARQFLWVRLQIHTFSTNQVEHSILTL